MRNPLQRGGGWGFEATYAGTVGPRIVNGALRLYADYGTNNDDSLASDVSVPTNQRNSAVKGVLTTIVRFFPIAQPGNGGNYTQTIVTNGLGDNIGLGHELRIDGSGSISIGYHGGNGYTRKGFVTTVTPTHDNWHTAVISNVPGTPPSVSVDGLPCPATLDGADWMIGDPGGYVLASSIVKLGHTASYPDYYHFNGLIELAVFLPGVYVNQSEAQELALDPYRIFSRVQREFIFDEALQQLASQYPELSLAELINILTTQATPRVTITVP